MLTKDESSPRRAAAAEFLRGARDIFPVLVATIPFGLVFGALAVKKGLSVAESVLMSGAVYGGAAQFVALEFWASPLPFWTILFSALAVNLRNVLYSAAVGRRMRHWTSAERYLGFTLLTDPAYAFAELKGGERLSVPYYFGLGIPLYVNWIATTLVGAVIGNLIGRPETIGLDFLVTGYFLYLVVGFRKRPNAAPVIVASAGAALAAYLVFGAPWNFAVGAVAGMGVAAVLAKPKQMMSLEERA
jgi:4-azaleucine resistance transporter AzlC